MNSNKQRQATGNMSFYPVAAERTLRQFIDAFWFEGALDGHLERQADGKADLYLRGVDEQGQQLEYRIAAHPANSFGRSRLHGPVFEVSSGIATHDIAIVAGNLLRPHAAQNGPRFINELIHTAAKQACSLQAQALTVKGRAALDLPYAWQEAQLGEGHLYHPCYRSRIGFTLADHQRYGPEFAQAFGLVWLALDKRLADIHSLPGGDYTQFLQEEIGTAEVTRLQLAIISTGKDAEDYYLLPAHPWHSRQCLQIQYADWLADGRLLYLGTGETTWLAQQSIRSLTSLASHSNHNLKLPLAIANSSADRILSDHHVHNAPLISQWLSNLCSEDIFLQQHCRLAILTEPMGITLTPAASRQDRYGLLGAIWRQSPTSILRQGEQIFPCTALITLDDQQQLNISPWLQQHGTEAWVKALLQAMLPPFIHLMLAHGVLLEAHAQNTVLIVKDGLPAGVAIRDLPGGLHYIAGQTSNEAHLQHLRQAPAHRNAANASNGFVMHTTDEARDYLLEVLLFIHLSELAQRLDMHHGFDESRFWHQAAQTVLSYQTQVPQLSARFQQFNLFIPDLQMEKLASRRLSAAQSQAFHAVPNPLHQFMQPPGV
ncbi:MAG: IucA/IucC family siderophore biosynthesis protein [Burkholderiales bacterium]|nr:IucA/IucC family siderophore biosynthesis protein [Burkholderiales bacterium]